MPRHPAFPNPESLLNCDPADSRRATPFAVGWRPFGAMVPNSETDAFGLGVLPLLKERVGERWSIPQTSQATSIDRARGMKVRRAGQGFAR